MQDTSLLQFHTEEEFESGLLYLYGRKKIRQSIQFLVMKGFVTQHENPNSRYRFDKTHYFLFHPEKVSSQLLDISDEAKMPHRRGQNASRSGQNAASSGQNAAPITEITSEISYRDSTDTPPPLPPSGEQNGVEVVDVMAGSFNQPLKEGAKTVLAYLNQVTGIPYRKVTFIEAILGARYTVEQCKRVIDWWDKVWTVNHPGQRDFFNASTPFKKELFEDYLPQAEKWDEQGRLAPTRQHVVANNPHGFTDKEARTMANIAEAMRLTEEEDDAPRRRTAFLQGPR